MKHPALLPFTIFLLAFASVGQNSQVGMHAPDGATWERINSILIPPILHAPFSGTVTAEWTRVLEDGSTLTTHNSRFLIRDGAGRIFQERRSFVPMDSGHEPELQRIEISDPAKHEKYFCRLQTHICTVENYTGPAALESQPSDYQEDTSGTLAREDLGKTVVNGVEAIGTRETRTLKPGAIGNASPLAIVKEFWYSPQIGINVSVKRIDPRFGTEIFNVTNLVLSEPDSKVFAVPSGFTIEDRRSDSKVTPPRLKQTQ